MGNANEGSMRMDAPQTATTASGTGGEAAHKLVTQMDFARAGVITDAMRAVRHLAAGLKPAGVGEGLSTKVNVNLGISGDVADAAVEWEKVATAERLGADAIMDLSNSGKTRFFRQELVQKTPLMVGTVPMYDAIGYMEKPLVKLTKDDLLATVRAHAEDGVDFLTIHCGINRWATPADRDASSIPTMRQRLPR